MKYLILTGKFGHGHISVAEAIQEGLLGNGENEVYIVDFIDYMFPHLKRVIYGGFNFLVGKFSKIYNLFNRVLAKNNKALFKEVMVKRIETLMDEYKPDAIISVIPAASGYISAYKKYTHQSIVLYTFITDICVEEEWINEYTDKYFVASIKTKSCLIDKGVNKEKIEVVGIPVKKAFQRTEKCGLKKEILIMGGGLGLIPNIDAVINYLEQSNDINTTIITGNNVKLYNRIKSKYKNIECVGFTSEIHEYINKADLIITKPGGVTLFEAIKVLVPMLVLSPFLQQEIGNAKYIEQNNIGRVVWNKDDLLKELVDVLDDEEKLKVMKSNLANIVSFLKPIQNFI